MPSAVGLKQVQTQVEPPVAQLHEAVWQAWLEKGRVQASGNFAAHMLAVKLASIAALLAWAGLWSQLAPYEVVVRCLSAGGAAVMMFQAFPLRRYAFAAVFGALVLLFNPVAVVLSFSADWQRSLVVLSAIPFVVSLTWRNERLA